MLRVTPEDISILGEDEFFVFGSNESGFHGAGAAAHAAKNLGAFQMVGFGPMGKSFAIPTKDWNVTQLPLPVIENYVQRFIAFTKIRVFKKAKFYVTRIGCGLAGYKVKDIAPMFADVIDQKNCWLPPDFIDYINGDPNGTTKPVILNPKTYKNVLNPSPFRN